MSSSYTSNQSQKVNEPNMSAIGASMPECVEYTEEQSDDKTVKVPPTVLASSLPSSSQSSSSLSSSSSSSSSSTASTPLIIPSRVGDDVTYTESSKTSTVIVPPAAIDSSLKPLVTKQTADLPFDTLKSTSELNSSTDSSKPSATHLVTATLRNQESYVVEESTSKIEQIKKEEQERIQQIEREMSAKLHVVEEKQRETQQYLREAEMNKALLITKEAELTKMQDQEKALIREIERQQEELKAAQMRIASFKEEVVEIRRRANAAQAKAEIIALEAPKAIETTTVTTEHESSTSSGASKLSSIGSSIKSMLGMSDSHSAEATSTQSTSTA